MLRDDRKDGINDIRKDIMFLHLHCNDEERLYLIKELEKIFLSNKEHYNQYADLKGLKKVI